MTNEQFTKHLREKIEAARAIENPADRDNQLKMLSSALKIMTYGTGPERRRFRRDYERRLAFKRSMKQELEQIKIIDGIVKGELED